MMAQSIQTFISMIAIMYDNVCLYYFQGVNDGTAHTDVHQYDSYHVWHRGVCFLLAGWMRSLQGWIYIQRQPGLN